MAEYASDTYMWLFNDHEKATIFKLISSYFRGNDISQNTDFLSHNIEDEEKENKYVHRGFIIISLLIQMFLKHKAGPIMTMIGSKLENFLNGHKISNDPESGRYISVVGHLDMRTELDREIQGGDGRYFATLSMMASKLVYENEAVIQKVVTDHWNMEFLKFYKLYNEFQEKFTTEAFIFRDPANDMIVVAFRGTSPFDADDWRTDIDVSWCNFKQMGKLHKGFIMAMGLQKCSPDKGDQLGDYRGHFRSQIDKDHNQPLAYYTIRDKLKEIMRKYKMSKFIVTGHSLGGALAVLFPAILALHNEEEILKKLDAIYTYGQPRVGNKRFGEFMKENLGKYKNIKYYRIVYGDDVVPRLPWDNKWMMFKHFGRCIRFNSLYQGKIEEERRNEKGVGILRECWRGIVKGIMQRLIAVWELIRGFLIEYTAGAEYREGWFLIVVRMFGILTPTLVNHNPQDYVNATRLTSEDLFLNDEAFMFT